MTSTTIKVGSRLSYNGELCTVKFIGEIPAWPEETAYGVEWDSIEKGKHNGAYKGINYFTTTDSLNSGSFLKSTKKYDDIQQFYSALIETYGTIVEDRDIKIGRKMVESYGFDKLQKLQSDFSYLRNISLSRKCLRGAVEHDSIEVISSKLQNLEELDLAFNLFTDLSDVISIAEHLNLKKLNLTGNRLQQVSKSGTIISLKSLNLTLSMPSSNVLEAIPTIFPNLENLYLQDNKMTQVTLDIKQFENLGSLDLSLNEFKDIPNDISGIDNLKALNISDNLITLKSSSLRFANIKTLDIRRNEISTWKEIEVLDNLFPKLEDLRINGNPIFDGKTLEEVEYIIITMLPKLKSLNGVKIVDAERTNAELYFFSKLKDGEIDYKSSRLEELSKKYNKDIKVVKSFKNNIEANILTLKLKNNSVIIEIQIIETLEFMRLRGMIGRLFKRDILDFQISYFIGHIKEVLSNDTSLISSFKFEQGQILLIENL